MMSWLSICHGLYKSRIDFVEKVNLLAAHKGRVNHSFLAQDDLGVLIFISIRPRSSGMLVQYHKVTHSIL